MIMQSPGIFGEPEGSSRMPVVGALPTLTLYTVCRFQLIWDHPDPIVGDGLLEI